MGVGVFPGSVGSMCVCMCCIRRKGAGRNRVYICAGAVNRAVTSACFRALVHTIGRAVKMSARLLAPRTVIGRSQEETDNASLRQSPLSWSMTPVVPPGSDMQARMSATTVVTKLVYRCGT